MAPSPSNETTHADYAGKPRGKGRQVLRAAFNDHRRIARKATVIYSGFAATNDFPSLDARHPHARKGAFFIAPRCLVSEFDESDLTGRVLAL
jgi:hypothetical protein